MPSIKRKYLIADAVPAVKKKRSTRAAVPPARVKDSPVFKVTPWYNRDEFCMVASSLFSKDIYAREWALNKIEVWQIRTYPALPVYIDVTVSLVRAKLQDVVLDKRISYASVAGVELMYAQALIRFVNIASEIVQYREKAISLRTALKKLKIPEWVLDLRDSCSHSKMPSLNCLRHAASHVLDFLQREYWDKEYVKHQNSFVPCPKKDNTYLEEKIYLLIKDCKSYVCRAQPCSIGESSRKLQAILSELANELVKRPTSVFDILIRPNLFLMDAGDMCLLDEQNFMDNGKLELPMFILKLWAPLIGVINSLNKIPQFVVRLMELQVNLSRFHQKMACSWIWKLIEMVFHDGDGTYDNSDPIFKMYTKKRWMFTWPSLLYVCSTNPSKCMIPILVSIIDQVRHPMPSKAMDDLVMMFFYGLNGLNLNNKDVSSRFNTFSDMQEYIAKEIEAVNGATEPPSKIQWELYSGIQRFSSSSCSVAEVRSSMSEPTLNAIMVTKDSLQLYNDKPELVPISKGPELPLGVVLGPVADFIGAPPKVDDGTVDHTSDIQDEETQNTEPTVNDQITTTSSTHVQVPFTSIADDLPEPTYIFTDDIY